MRRGWRCRRRRGQPSCAHHTIGDLRRDGKALEIGCINCARQGYFNPHALALPDALPVPQTAARLRYGRCVSSPLRLGHGFGVSLKSFLALVVACPAHDGAGCDCIGEASCSTRQLEREMDADRFTRLDRMLIAEQEASDAFAADLRPDRDMLETARRNRALLIARARKLESMRLATEVEVGRWSISAKAEPTLRELGERGDIIKAMHRAVEREGLTDQRHPSRYVMHRDKIGERIVGRVLSKGLGGDELGERVHLVIDGVDGRVHHVELDASRAEDISRGMIVEANPAPSKPRAADRNILLVADEQGIYRPSDHLQVARDQAEHIRADPETFVTMHVRRLEALRRAGIVERIDADHWQVPGNLAERGLAHDLARDGAGVRINTVSPIGLNRQVGHEGATWLDRTMIGHRDTVAAHGFGADVRAAWDRRKLALADLGLARDAGNGNFRAPRDLIQRLETMDLESTGKALATERGRQWLPSVPGNYVMGQLVGSTQLASSRFAMIDDGFGFSLVPWQPALEKRLGQHISGVVMPGGGVDWSFGRKRGLGL